MSPPNRVTYFFEFYVGNINIFQYGGFRAQSGQFNGIANRISRNKKSPDLRISQRNGLKLDKDLIFSGLVQNVYVYRMAKSKRI